MWVVFVIFLLILCLRITVLLTTRVLKHVIVLPASQNFGTFVRERSTRDIEMFIKFARGYVSERIDRNTICTCNAEAKLSNCSKRKYSTYLYDTDYVRSGEKLLKPGVSPYRYRSTSISASTNRTSRNFTLCISSSRYFEYPFRCATYRRTITLTIRIGYKKRCTGGAQEQLS